MHLVNKRWCKMCCGNTPMSLNVLQFHNVSVQIYGYYNKAVVTYMAKKEEWQKKSEASPHPGLKSLCRDTGGTVTVTSGQYDIVYYTNNHCVVSRI